MRAHCSHVRGYAHNATRLRVFHKVRLRREKRVVRQREDLGSALRADETVDPSLVSVAVGWDNERGLFTDAREVELRKYPGRELRQGELHNGRKGRGLQHVGGTCHRQAMVVTVRRRVLRCSIVGGGMRLGGFECRW